MDLPSNPPKGTGIFYLQGTKGIRATVPVAVTGSEVSPEGDVIAHHVAPLTGGEYTLKLVPGLKDAVFSEKAEEKVVLVPDTIRFLSVDDERSVSLVGDLSSEKEAAEKELSFVQLYGDGQRYGASFQNAPHLSSLMSKHASADDAVFMLCMAGYDAVSANSLVKQATLSSVRIPVEDLSPIQEKRAGVDVSHLRQDLVKEAAALPDIQTIDSVLSLGFITPDNVNTFLSRIPYLERALNHTCELVLAARLGLSEIPEYASARAMRGLDSVIQGLKALSLRNTQEEEL